MSISTYLWVNFHGKIKYSISIEYCRITLGLYISKWWSKKTMLWFDSGSGGNICFCVKKTNTYFLCSWSRRRQEYVIITCQEFCRRTTFKSPTKIGSKLVTCRAWNIVVLHQFLMSKPNSYRIMTGLLDLIDKNYLLGFFRKGDSLYHWNVSSNAVRERYIYHG